MPGGALSIFRRVNLRHLWGHKLRTLLTVLGIASGVALVFSIQVINATLLSSLQSSVRDLGGAAEFELAASDTTGFDDAVIEEVEAIDGVEAAVPVLRTMTRLTGGGGSERVLIIGVRPDIVELFPTSGSLAARTDLDGGFGSGDGLLASSTLAASIGSPLGATVAVTAPSGSKPLEVTGILEGGPEALLNGGQVGVMLLEAAQTTFDRPRRVDSIYVVADPGAAPDELKKELVSVVGARGSVGAPGERAAGFEDTFSALSTLTSLAGMVSLFVAMFVVYNTMTMALTERRRELAMSQAFGATRRALFTSFLGEATALGLIASTLGVGGGTLLASALVERSAEQYSLLPVSASGPLLISGGSIVLAVVGGLLVAVAGAFGPARRILGVTPIEALRPEAAYEWGRSLSGRRRGPFFGAGMLVMALVLLAAFARNDGYKILAALGLFSGLAGLTLLLPSIVGTALRLLRPLAIMGGRTTARLAMDALQKNPGRTTYTVGALVLTLSMVVSIGAALGSYERQIEEQLGTAFAAPLYVGSDSFTGLGSDQPLVRSFETDIEAVDGVDFAYPQRYGSLEFEGRQALLYALPPDDARRAGGFPRLGSSAAEEEALFRSLEQGDLIISALMAENHDLSAGDEIELPTPSGSTSFEVAGIFPDLASFDSFYISIDVYSRIWDDDKADRFAVLLEPGADVSVVQADLREVVQTTETPASVVTKRVLIGGILETVKGLFSIARGIRLAALIIAALTIANTMFTAVFERRWESGLSRALGMSGGQLRQVVVLEAAGIGLIGGGGAALFGLVLGKVMTLIMETQFSWEITYRIPWTLMTGAVLGGIVIAALAGLPPGRMARRAPIIES
nr:ABC transporter permease [Actinomycetota bacterium]